MNLCTISKTENVMLHLQYDAIIWCVVIWILITLFLIVVINVYPNDDWWYITWIVMTHMLYTVNGIGDMMNTDCKIYDVEWFSCDMYADYLNVRFIDDVNLWWIYSHDLWYNDISIMIYNDEFLCEVILWLPIDVILWWWMTCYELYNLCELLSTVLCDFSEFVLAAYLFCYNSLAYFCCYFNLIANLTFMHACCVAACLTFLSAVAIWMWWLLCPCATVDETVCCPACAAVLPA